MSFHPNCELIIRTVEASTPQKSESNVKIHHLPCDEAVDLLRDLHDKEHSIEEICNKQRIIDKHKITYGNQSYKDSDPLNCRQVADRIENIMLRSKL